MIKTLMGSIRDYMKVTVATPLLVLGEVLCEMLIPFITANLIDAIKDGATVAEMLPTAGFLVLIALTSLAFGAAAGVTCSHASCGFAKNLRHDLFYKIQTFSFANIDEFSTSSLVTRLTTDITLPSRYLVFMPGASHVGVSQRIESESERERLKKVVAEYCDEQGGFIIRTAAEGVGEAELASDAAYLKRVWTKVMERKKRPQTRYQLYGELALAQRVLRDFADAELDRIRVDSRLTYEALLEFTSEYIPEMTSKLEHYTGRQPIFDLFDVENEIQRALERKVELKSGGYLIIDQTEAMTTVDINTGAFVGHRNLDDTIFNTNIEATQAIARQLRLRNLGGIIIIDFIDMNNEDHRRRVLHSLEQALSKDRVKTSVNGFSALGLVEMTRKRTRESIEHVLCNECPTCHGRGTVKTVETVCYEIMREIVRVHHAYDSDRFLVYASPAVAEALKGEESHSLAEVEIFVGKQVKVQIEPLYNQEQFDVVMM